MAELDLKVPPKRDRKAYNRSFYLRNKSSIKERTSKHRQDNYAYYRDKAKSFYTKHRYSLLEQLGGACTSCGFSDLRALQIDHTNGNGAKERKEHRGSKLYKNMLELLTENPDQFHSEYQLLCANCNWIKRSEKKELNPKTKYGGT